MFLSSGTVVYDIMCTDSCEVVSLETQSGTKVYDVEATAWNKR
jgi:hypothetical protein